MSHIQLHKVSVQFPIYRNNENATFLQKMIGTGVTKSTFYALKDLNISFQDGDRVALLGKNGSGKSTLLNVLAGLLPPSSGSIDVQGEVFPALTAAPGIVREATCAQNIILQGLSYGLSGQALRDYVTEVGEYSDLGDFLNSPYSSLSAGMRSRFAVSTLCQAKPELLFMDEWVGASDKKVLEKNKGLLSSVVANSHIFVLASHRKELVKDHCNRALVLREGELIFDGLLDEGLEIVDE